MSDNLVIPKSVSKQGELADQIIAALQQAQVETPPSDENQPQESAANKPNENPQDKPITDNSQQQNNVAQGKETPPDIPTDTPLAPDANNPTPSDPATDTPEYWKNVASNWEHKYAALAGKFNKEIEQQKHLFYSAKPELDQLRADKEQLEQTVQKLTLQLADKSQGNSKSSTLDSPEIMELLTGLKEEYGDELVSGFMKIISAVDANAASQLETINTTVEDVRQKASATTQQHEQQIYQHKIGQLTDLLAKSSIDFKRVDDDPLFHEWLSKFDPQTGQQRQQILMSLFHANELNSVAGMYAEYIKDSGAVYSNNANPPVEPLQSQSQQPVAKVDLNEQVQIQTNAPVNTELPADKKIWTGQQIADFYTNVSKGKYSKEEATKLEREIFEQLKG